MYVDQQIEFSDAQVLTASAISTNVYDTLTTTTGGALPPAASPNIRSDAPPGSGAYLVISTPVGITDAGSDATLQADFVSADDPALTTGVVVHFSTGVLAFGAFSAPGSLMAAVGVPIGLYKRYIGIKYTVGAGPLTAGAIDAFVTTNVQWNRVYKSGFTIQ
jgi:hypothetical protein